MHAIIEAGVAFDFVQDYQGIPSRQNKSTSDSMARK
jgi:hypothetical protein